MYVAGEILSMDATFKATKKATIAGSENKGQHQKAFETISTVINEHSQIMSWVRTSLFCIRSF